MWIFILKVIIAIVLWLACHYICERIVFDEDASDYQKFMTYGTMWCGAFLIMLLILSLF